MLSFCAFVAASRPATLTIELMAGMVLGLYLFWKGFKVLQERRLILDTPQSNIRSAAMGLVEVSGLACGPSTINAPISALSCYYYSTTVWQYKQSGRNKAWVKVAQETNSVPFYLDDNTGRLMINPDGAEMDIHCDFKQEYSNSFFSSFDSVPGNVRAFLARYNANSDYKTKVEERCIKPKNALFVLGTLTDNPALTAPAEVEPPVEDPPMAEEISMTSAAAAGAGSNVSHSTVNKVTDPAKLKEALLKAGITNPAAWQAAGVSLGGATLTGSGATSSSGDFDSQPKTVLMKGAQNPTFLISWRSQREVVASLGWQSALKIWGGPAITLICLYCLAQLHGWF